MTRTRALRRDQRRKQPLEGGGVPGVAGRRQRIGRDLDDQRIAGATGKPSGPGKGPGVARDRLEQQPCGQPARQDFEHALGQRRDAVGEQIVGRAPAGVRGERLGDAGRKDARQRAVQRGRHRLVDHRDGRLVEQRQESRFGEGRAGGRLAAMRAQCGGKLRHRIGADLCDDGAGRDMDGHGVRPVSAA